MSRTEVQQTRNHPKCFSKASFFFSREAIFNYLHCCPFIPVCFHQCILFFSMNVRWFYSPIQRWLCGDNTNIRCSYKYGRHDGGNITKPEHDKMPCVLCKSNFTFCFSSHQVTTLDTIGFRNNCRWVFWSIKPFCTQTSRGPFYTKTYFKWGSFNEGTVSTI